MIQYYLDLQKQIQNIKELSLTQGQIQKIYSTAYYISIAIRIPGKTWYLYIGRGSGHEGVWVSEKAPPSAIRRKDNYLEYLRRHLSSCSFLELKLDSFDRIVQFNYQKFGLVQSFLFFWKGRHLYFVHIFKDSPDTPQRALLSWRGKAAVLNDLPDDLNNLFDEVGRQKNINHDLVNKSPMDIINLLEQELTQVQASLPTLRPHFLQRKKNKIEQDLCRAQNWRLFQKVIDQNQPLESVTELQIGDQKLNFHGDLNTFEKRNLIFNKIKKLKRGEAILLARLREVETLMLQKETKSNHVVKLPMAKPIWNEGQKTTILTEAKKTDQFYKVINLDGYQVGIGLNAQGNDQLRNRWASKEDYWVHLDEKKSSHAVVKVSNQGALSPDILNMAASLVAHFSHFQEEWIPIIYTQVKNLKGVPGAPGMVTYKKEKRLRCSRIILDQSIKE